MADSNASAEHANNKGTERRPSIGGRRPSAKDGEAASLQRRHSRQHSRDLRDNAGKSHDAKDSPRHHRSDSKAKLDRKPSRDAGVPRDGKADKQPETKDEKHDNDANKAPGPELPRKKSLGSAQKSSDNKEHKEPVRRNSVGGHQRAPSHNRRPSMQRTASTEPRKREGPNFLAQFDNDKLSCKPKKKKKKSKAGEKTEPENGLSRLDIADLWAHYDKNQNGILDMDEVEELAEDVLDRIPTMYREMLRKEKPNAPEKVLDDIVKTDMKHIKPGNKLQIVNYLNQKLPFNYPANKKIREHEFASQWNQVAKYLFQGLHEGEATEISCTIL